MKRGEIIRNSMFVLWTLAVIHNAITYIDGLVQDRSISSALWGGFILSCI